MPEGVTDRAADIWEPLLAIADLAGADWPERARAAATAIVSNRVAEDQSLGVRLLADIKAVFVAKLRDPEDADRIATFILLQKLNALDESGWGGWNDGKGMDARDLSRKLKPHHIAATTIRFTSGSTFKGYYRKDFADAWARYLRDPASVTNPVSVTNPSQDSNTKGGVVTDVTDVTPVAEGGTAFYPNPTPSSPVPAPPSGNGVTRVTSVTSYSKPAENIRNNGVTASVTTPIRRRCPDGHACSQPPSGSFACCGQPLDLDDLDAVQRDLDALRQEVWGDTEATA